MIKLIAEYAMYLHQQLLPVRAGQPPRPTSVLIRYCWAACSGHDQ